MKRHPEARARGAHGARISIGLAAAALAAAAAMVWGGMSAVATVSAVNAAPRAGQPASTGPSGAPAGARPAPSTTAAAPAAAAKGLPAPGNTRKTGPLPATTAGPSASAGTGDAPEVSLAQAASAEAGTAASLPEGGDSTGLKQRGPVDPAAVLSDASQSLGGCLPQYGSAGQCLPVVPPSLSQHLKEMKDAGLDPSSMPHTWTCTEVRAYFKNGLAVRQAHIDPQRLDTNHDGLACGPTD